MTAEEGLELLEQILAPTSLNKVQSLVFKHAWEDRSYKQIADEFDYTLGYIKDTGCELWQLLSTVFGQKVTRRNFQTILKNWVQTGTPTRNLEKDVQISEFTLHDRIDWGEVIDVSRFYNRIIELATLKQWIQHDRCRLIAILGIGGVGKTALSVKLAEQAQDDFEFVVWRSLRHAPSLPDLLADLIPFLSQQQTVKLPEVLDAQISCLMRYLRQRRCLLVLDNVESILQSGERSGRYCQGYEAYGQLIARVSDERHQSCLVLTSREKPAEVSIREGDILPARSLQLTGLKASEAQKILDEKGLHESNAYCRQLIEYYSGNPLALKIAAATIRSLFNGDVKAFLNQGIIAFGDINELFYQQFDRLSQLEQQVMYWLAISRKWLMLEELQEGIIPKTSRRELLEAVASLQARSLIETSTAGFSQQPVVMECWHSMPRSLSNSTGIPTGSAAFSPSCPNGKPETIGIPRSESRSRKTSST
ncbi:WD-40 repeat-containing protein [Leptolyngbya boryana NIES-2135]|jgi:hypothetical protein|uniref:WD-40 repeat-containing protein n=1 Tax=Leptolyngbya boryana NIES-2135 TaxID=1973484 RepID=A0A1Z4JJ75_LEPBY|nr:WD-40 repeat-containing protein [Leptolyngbya boryana NIES-2135]